MSKDRTRTTAGIPCQRCGACCEKGGPALHTADRHLVESGRIPLKYLFTIRPGETVRDNVQQRLTRSTADIIKIKGKKGTWACVFFDAANKACTLYADHPLECRVLDCRRPEALESLYTRNRLTRKDLLYSMNKLWELVQDHEQHCSLEKVTPLFSSSGGPIDSDAQKRLAFIFRYDTHLRRLVVEKGKMDPQLLDFLFGRPLSVLYPHFGNPVPP